MIKPKETLTLTLTLTHSSPSHLCISLSTVSPPSPLTPRHATHRRPSPLPLLHGCCLIFFSMEREDGMNNNSVEERDEEGYVGEEDHEEEEREEEEEDGVGVAEEGEEGEDEMDCDMRFEGNMNPLDLISNDNCGVQLFKQLEQLEYEALAEKKQKALDPTNNGEGSVKRPRREETRGATFEEILEAMNYGARRRSRKPKKKGRRKGSKKKNSPEITRKLGDATLHYAHGRYEEAIRVLTEVVLLAPNLPDPYHTLGLVYNSMGDKKRATDCYMLAAVLSPKECPLWKVLVTWSIEQGLIDQAWHCLKKAIRADPGDITLRYHHASLCMEMGDHQKAAESYYQIVQICPENVEALRTMEMLYKKCGQLERSISILEDYLKDHPPKADLTVVDMLASSYMECNDHLKALQQIEHARQVYDCGKEFPLHLIIKEGICQAHLGDMEKAEICFDLLRREQAKPITGLVVAVANSFMSLQHYEYALKYYLMLEGCASNNELINVKIARCYSALKDTASAVQFYYRALHAREDDVDIRLTLACLLLEENRREEALALLSPPPNAALSNDTDRSEPWWHNVKIKLKLSHIYRSNEMLEAFVEVIYPIVHESMVVIDSMRPKVKQRRRIPFSELEERAKLVDEPQNDSVFGKFRRPVSKNILSKGNRAKQKIEERNKEKSAALAAGLDWESDESDDEIPQQPPKEPPLPDLFTDVEHYNLILDLCMALASLRRDTEAMEIITLTLKLTSKIWSAEKREKFRSLGAQISFNITDPFDGYDCVRHMVQQCPQSISAWNYYYRLVLRLENRVGKHGKFLLQMRNEHKDLVPPMIIYGNRCTMKSYHQLAAKEYLEAYKQMPECPLINLCVGTSLVNLALGLRLQNKHQCVAQGLAFLYNNLRLCDNSQEALYNIARAYHHVGLVSLAASYYEKVLATRQEDCPLPELLKEDKDPKPGYCNLRREAAYNLHLIYKRSGAVDLARQILRDYCTV